jgi:hypothetical protein
MSNLRPRRPILSGCLSFFLLSAVPVFSSSYFPFAQGNTWILTGGGQSMTLTVDSVARIGNVERATVKVTSPWSSYAMILRGSDSGIQLEALQYPQFRAGFPDLLPFFEEGTAGQVWNSPYVMSTLVSGSNIIETAKGAFRNVRRYDISFPGSGVQTWYLAPDFGPVQFGTTGGLTLSSYILEAGTPSAQAATQTVAHAPCPAIGITPNPPANGDFSVAGEEAILRTVLAGGSKLIPISASWGQLETAPGTYSFSAITDYVNWAAKYNVPAVLTIKTIDTTGVSMPKDLAGSSWNDPQVIARWEAFLRALMPKLNTNVKWINLGNEVDTYLQAHPAEIQTYAQFLLQGEITIAQARPGVSTGAVFSFGSYRLNDFVFRALSPLCGHVSFTYYDQDPVSATSAVRDPSNAAFDISDMVAAASGKQLVLTEVGYPSSTGAGSSPALQQSFYTNAFAALSSAGGKVTAANFAFLSDFPSSALTSLGANYNTAAMLWMNWAGSLGLIDAAGKSKPALQTFYSNAQKLQTANACTVN